MFEWAIKHAYLIAQRFDRVARPCRHDDDAQRMNIGNVIGDRMAERIDGIAKTLVGFVVQIADRKNQSIDFVRIKANDRHAEIPLAGAGRSKDRRHSIDFRLLDRAGEQAVDPARSDVGLKRHRRIEPHAVEPQGLLTADLHPKDRLRRIFEDEAVRRYEYEAEARMHESAAAD